MHTRHTALLAGTACVLAWHFLTPAPVAAQAARVGDTQIAMTYSLGRWPDIEYDTTNKTYLAVRGYHGSVLGAFLRPDGTPFTGPFVITQATNVTTARVCYAGDANIFLVTWLQEPSFVKGRLLRFGADGNPTFLTDIFLISTIGAKFPDAAPSCAYSPDSDRFLVTWTLFGSSLDIRGQFVSLTGGLTLGEIPIAVSGAWEALPSVAYNTRRKEFYVVYTQEIGRTQTSTGTRIDPTSGNILETRGVYAGLGLNNYPEVAYNSRDDEYLIVTWYFSPLGADVWGHRADGTGGPIGDKIPVAANPFFEGGDGIGLAYNAATNSYFMASQGPSGEAIGAEVSAGGVPSPVFRVTVLNDGHKEIYQPQIAGNPDNSQFLVVANVDFSRLAAQPIGSSPVSSCPYTLNDNGVNLLPSGGSGQVTVTTTADCTWSATSNAPWLEVLSASSGSGTGTIQYRVARNSSTAPRAAALSIGSKTFIVGQGGATVVVLDFNRDGSSDILWQNQTTGVLSAWRMAGVNLLEGVLLSPAIVSDTRWRIVATPDLNRDGKIDILWQHDLGYVAIWYMDGERQVSGDLLTASPLSDRGWRIVAAGDVDGDGSADFVWQHTDGRVAVWYMDGARFRSGDVIIDLDDHQWRVTGATDVNGDRRLDLVWHHAVRGDVAVWFMANRVLLDGVLVNSAQSDLDWQMVAVSDVDRDGAPDFVWRHRSSGQLAAWMMDGALLRHGILLNPSTVPDNSWKIVGPR